jgi:multidrug resistance efflux pump
MHRRVLPSKLSGIVWLGVVATTATLTWFFHGDRAEFRGIAEDAKAVVSSESAVEVIEVRVEPGQVVVPGDTLVRLRSPELAMRMAEVQHDIEGANGDADMNQSESRRRAAQLRAEFASKRAELMGEIRNLSDLHARNRSLVSGFKAMGLENIETDSTGLQEQIQALRHQIAVEEAGTRNQVALLEGSKGSMDRLAASKEQALRNELALLHEEEKRLVIISTIAGIVDSIHHHPGEKVSPFSPIMTISGHRPALVRGYVHERVRTDLAVGDSVEVIALGMRPADVRGKVLGLGSRIVELPARMWKAPGVPLWGREVIVRIDTTNPLLQGEMVSVQRTEPRIGGRQ